MSPEALEWAELIETPVMEWPGRCHEIASALVDNGHPGRAVYGMYFGPIHPKAPSFGGAKMARHGWIEVQRTREIVDPTRWVFEQVDPYIYRGPLSNEEYDFGMLRFRQALALPLPPFDPDKTTVPLPDDKDLAGYILDLLGMPPRTREINDYQAVRVLGLPRDVWSCTDANSLLDWILVKVARPALMPIDVKRWLMHESNEQRRSTAAGA